eukprot:515014-Pelagomonas_calceolata.AAC.10
MKAPDSFHFPVSGTSLLSFPCFHATLLHFTSIPHLGPPPGTNAGSLLHLLDRTHTPTGSRLLREWVVRPLTELPAIQARLDAVEELAAGARTHQGQISVRGWPRYIYVKRNMCISCLPAE